MPGTGGVSVAQKGLVFDGFVTRVISNTEFMAAGLAGFGNTFFQGWSAYVARKADGTGLPPQGEGPLVLTYNSSNGDFTHAAYTVPLSVGDELYLLHPALYAFGFQLAKLQGTTPISNSVIANWQAGEQDLVTLGAPGVRYKLHQLTVDISATGGNINIRMYMAVNGVQRLIFPPKPVTWAAATDSTGVVVVNGTIGIYNPIRVTCQSDNVADNGVAIAYQYFLEAM
jgi:hypothetical protein